VTAHLELTASGRSHVVLGGPWSGHRVGTARKAGRCQHGGGCRHKIQPGEKFVYGELDPYAAGGFAQARYCLTCAGVSP
jgi:hypothetical protein